MLTEPEKKAIRDHYRAISENLPQFRPRAAQREMIAAIARAFSRSKAQKEDSPPPVREGESIAVIEGPTGVGKSLSYLLAGGIMAQTRGKRLVVSSATIALQEQLVNRDLPFLVEKSGLQLDFALAKGRGRYLCPYKLYALTQSNAQDTLDGLAPPPDVLWHNKPTKDDLALLRGLADGFAARRFDGDRDNWPEKIPDALWQQVSNDRYGCLKNNCPNRAECPFYLAREQLDNVDVIVANHDLLLSDIAMGGGVILPSPENCFYCIDEAHHLAKKAVNRFAAAHSLEQAMWLAEKLPAMAHKIALLTDKHETAARAEEAAAALQEGLAEWQYHLDSAPELDLDGSGNPPVWLWQDGAVPGNLAILASNTAAAAYDLLRQIEKLDGELAACRRSKGTDAPPIDRAATELGQFAARAEQISAVWSYMDATVPEGAPPLAKWIERRIGERKDYIFNASPISGAAQLAGGLWRRAAGAVLTSATLRSLGGFDFLLQQTGLSRLPATTALALDSPFDFAKQGELYLPPLEASPKHPAAHTEAVAEWLPKLIAADQAVGTLVLFSSRKQMSEVAMRLPEAYLPLLLVQGDIPKAALLARHRQAVAAGKASIIFGLDSFAEGLDLPGDLCVHVIIVKLPFSMPDNPIEKTQSRWIESRGGNPFNEITVPEAGIKLVQAAGRLIRTESDYGRVSILDNRIQTQSYGRRLLACLPPFKRIG
ncbi:MAG: ATP-dependent DNA helicase DinG [Neisseria sp.]|nr:ATP-dependent DNA helicase DinG [Neisseria sp.]